jgi:hypothetical protein
LSLINPRVGYMSIYHFTVINTKTGARSSVCIPAADIEQAYRRHAKHVAPNEIIVRCEIIR